MLIEIKYLTQGNTEINLQHYLEPYTSDHKAYLKKKKTYMP